MILVGIDPGNTVTGLGVASLDTWDARPEVLLLGFVRPAAGHGARSIAEGVWSTLRKVEADAGPRRSAGGTFRRYERPPDRARQDTNHGAQAGIGWKLGFLCGVIVGTAPDAPPREAFVQHWRSNMFTLAARWGVVVHPPAHGPPRPAPSDQAAIGRTQAARLERVGGGLELVWAGCEHRDQLTLVELERAPRRCPTCSREPMVAEGDDRPDRAAWVRGEWKRIACEATRRIWPAQYDAMVQGPRSRARSVTPDHQLQGVSDACEALWIGLSTILDRAP